MSTQAQPKLTSAKTARWWLLATGILPFAGTVALAARNIWEETVWTWERGPQAVGFSLAHGSAGILFFAPILLAIWAVCALGVNLHEWAETRRMDWVNLVLLGAALLALGLLSTPAGVWQRMFIQKMVASPYAEDLLVHAAYDGDFRTVEAMVDHGMSVQSRDHRQWRTGLHAAAGTGDSRLVEFLISRGANVNALDRAGDSPTELAASAGHPDCERLLRAHGGERIRGTEARHQRALDFEVQEDVREMRKNPTQ